MTLKDIAQLAGVSISTVSRVINSPDGSFATKEVRDRVWNTIKETGYVPNQIAQALRKGQYTQPASRAITCIYGRSHAPSDNPFFVKIARAIEQESLKDGYVVSSTYSIHDINNDAVLQRITAIRTEGAIVMGRFNSSMRTFLDKQYKNIIYVGLNSIDAEWDQVICDGYDIVKTALEYLVNKGHSRIGYIGETSGEVRFEAYKDFIHKKGLDADPTIVIGCRQDALGGYQAAESLVNKAKRLPTALFCANDITAIAAMKRLKELGVRVPDKLSIISIDDIEMAQYVSPMLTTVAIPKEELGKMAAQMLFERINLVRKMPIKVVLPHHLLVRESVSERY